MSPEEIVRIEPFALPHAPAVQRLAADPRVLATTLMPDPYPDDGAEQFAAVSAAVWEAGTDYTFAVFAGDAGEHARPLVGLCGLKEVDRYDRQAELGYWIGVPFWGRGYATAAARLVVAFGFETLGLARVTAHTLARNPASGRVLDKVGFHLVGPAPNPYAKWAPDDVILRYVRERAV